MSAFHLEVGGDGIAILTFDVPGTKVNTFSGPVLRELAQQLTDLEKRTDLRGLILRSGKAGQFIAGADLNELAALAYATPEQATKGLNLGHDTFTRLSKLPFPTVALIDGPTMGGGTEVALALDYRLCGNGPKVQIGLPETKLGILPGWGGTQRLPRLIGVHHAIEMITTGEPVKPDKAVKFGLVWDAVPSDKLLEAGMKLLEQAIATGEWKENRKKRSQPLGLTEDQFHFTFAVAEGAVAAKTQGQYPAPLVALACIKEGCNLPLEQGLEVEKKKALEVMGSPISAALIANFFQNNKLERDPGVADRNIKPREVKRVGVLGAGLMGSGIAAAHARAGFPTVMCDVNEQFVTNGMNRAKEVVASRIKIGRAKPEDLADLLSKLQPTTNTNAFAEADVVIEAITEDEKLKTENYKKFIPQLKDGVILASNTSTISITRLAEATPFPERFIGMHFFNPVDRMQLVEVIRGAKTSDETVATIVALAKKIRKTPIVVRDCAGFLVNRILFPYLTEAVLLLQEGADMDAIDKAATKFGMPMGPILLYDVVGNDTSFFAGNVIAAAYPDRAVALPILGEMVQAKRLGQKSGSGFRKFTPKNTKGERDPGFEEILKKYRTGDKQFTPPELTDRLFLPMLFEASRAMEENIARDPGDLDMALVLGIGFPPFRGGILRWCDTEGAANIVQRAAKYVSLGKRFEPTEMIKRMATSDEKFFPKPKDLRAFGE
jgi:3-hydroxyacyl-CoA dehydrogenase/enoyl-CoA hydratase/3-hydroxybutyryl-CoA epimerase/3-hydroxyacyl-CoA dehydrogenase/enoyl-CoA hydratase/3-hydroxybutyryl-CoA epimerase/enoyl-CoA isomerase